MADTEKIQGITAFEVARGIDLAGRDFLTLQLTAGDMGQTPKLVMSLEVAREIAAVLMASCHEPPPPAGNPH